MTTPAPVRRTRTLLLSVVLLCQSVGCSLTSQQSSVVAPKSTVLATATGRQQPWLKTAELTYWKPSVPASGIQPVSHTQSTDRAGFTVLGVRYPHPSGKPGVARVELVVAGPEESDGGGSWFGGLRQAIDETLPGMTWGAGIRQAKSLDIPVSELQEVLQNTRTIMLSSVSSQAPPNANLIAEVNDRRTTHQTVPLATFETLKKRVAQEGRLISYHGTAGELRQRLGSDPVVLAQRTPPNDSGAALYHTALVPLPPVR